MKAKKLFIIFLTLAMVVGLLQVTPLTVGASDVPDGWQYNNPVMGEYGMAVDNGYGNVYNAYTIPINSEADLQYAMKTSHSIGINGICVRFAKDMEIESLVLDEPYKDFTFRLNGHSLKISGNVCAECTTLEINDGVISFPNNSKENAFCVKQLAVISNVTFDNCKGRIFYLPHKCVDDDLTVGYSFTNVTFNNCVSGYEGTCVNVTSNNGQTGTTSFDNCRFINCKSNGNEGGGVYIEDVEPGQRVTFNNCYISDCSADQGGFIYVDDDDADVSFENCTGLSCRADEGGFIYIENATKLSFDKSLVVNCTAEYGGFMYIWESDIAVSGTLDNGTLVPTTYISGCSTTEDGGAVYISDYSGVSLRGFVFSDNSAGSEACGGAIYDDSSDCKTSACRFYNNKAEVGGGIYVDSNGSVTDCKFFRNTATDEGNDIYSDDGDLVIKSEFQKASSSDNRIEGDYDSSSAIIYKYANNDTYTLSGTGEKDNPYTIGNLDDWDSFVTMVNLIGNDFDGKYIIFTNDLTVPTSAGIKTNNAGTTKPFCGTLDGSEKTVTLMLNGNTDNKGLIGCADENALVKNLLLEGFVSGGNSVGSVYGNCLGGTAENCTNYAEITGNNDVGGIAGIAENGAKIKDCTNNGRVKGNNRVGGLAGKAFCLFLNSINYGSIVCSANSQGNYIGGLIGTDNESGAEVKNCLSLGTVTASCKNRDAIIGNQNSTSEIVQCFYPKEVFSENKFGIGLSNDALTGKSSDNVDGKAYCMPDAINDYISKASLDLEGWTKAYFKKDNTLAFSKTLDKPLTVWGESGENTGYTVAEDMEIDTRILVLGNVSLYLSDGCTLTASEGITLEEGNTLNIFGNSASPEKAGKLIATGKDGNAGIGGIIGQAGKSWFDKTEHSYDGDSGSPGSSCGILNLYGGAVFASGEIGFGGGRGGKGGDGIEESFFHAIGGNGGNGGNGGVLAINGGYFNAVGTEAAVGGGKGESGGLGEINGATGDDGTKTNITTTDSLEIKAGNSENDARIVTAYDNQKYLSIMYKSENKLSLKVTGNDFTVTPYGKDAGTGVIAVALYENETSGKFLEAKTLEITDTSPVTGTFTKNGYVKAFWWSNLDDIMPLCKAEGAPMSSSN